MEPTPEQEPAPVEPAMAIQNVLSDLGGESMAVGFACVVEWLEPDGSTSIEVINTDMPPWHMKGLLGWAQEMTGQFFLASDSLVIDDDDDF